MATPEPPDFAAAFMDDYYAEADDHLVALRRGLLALESAIGDELPAPTLEELFRRFHSLKGISAMVELREAEQLAHQMESMLRALREGVLTLTGESFQLLVDGVNLLEQVIAARRGASDMPVITPQLDALGSVLRSRAGDDPSAVDSRPEAESAGSADLWRVTFVPSAALVSRGVKVDTIRTRLTEIGQVVSVSPQVLAGGRISFEFQVRLENPRLLAEWDQEGLSYERITGDSSPASAHAPTLQPSAVYESAVTNFVRVDLARLDDLMRLVGDLVVTRSRLEDTLQRLERHVPAHEWRALQEHGARLERQVRDLREGVMRVRLVPVAEIFRRMPFVVRDLARDSGKRVRLELSGQSTEIDKFLIERMMDPMLHLVRNCVSHGIETPDARITAGKPPEGVIRLAASTAGESVVIDISDDGAGIDTDAVIARARKAGLIGSVNQPDARALLDILCSSGFSTRDEADRASGRGVGLAVVRGAVQELGGTLALESQRDRGTTFTITLPVTLAITEAIITHVGDQIFAIPQASVREVIEVSQDALRSIERNDLLVHRGTAIPAVRLARVFGLQGRNRATLHGLIVGTGAHVVALLVDRISGQQEIVVKTMTDPLTRVDGVSGATELGDGRLVLIVDVATLSRRWGGGPQVAEGVA